MQALFISETLGQYRIIFDIDKTIIKVIFGDMLYSMEDKANDGDNDFKYNEEK